MKERMNKFSVGLGLFDYINPIFYSITSITIMRNLHGDMSKGLFILLLLGCFVSIVFGLTIPTVKFLVGLGKIKFKMPVNLVFYVNSGILLSGITVFIHIFKLSPWINLLIIVIILAILVLIYLKTKKFNSVAVITGLLGYSLIYSSMIATAIRVDYKLSIVLYALAICCCIFLVLLGCKSDLMKPRVHWAIEITNVVCQGLVALSTVLLFHH